MCESKDFVFFLFSRTLFEHTRNAHCDQQNFYRKNRIGQKIILNLFSYLFFLFCIDSFLVLVLLFSPSPCGLNSSSLFSFFVVFKKHFSIRICLNWINCNAAETVFFKESLSIWNQSSKALCCNVPIKACLEINLSLGLLCLLSLPEKKSL